ncbi:hypothetical protein LBMAG33_3210 [Candidatus Levyibacteriota bacterium]|nr:hypothetical protein LBMAG33_3210 [Candidatus Levybacteria bacterium]
MIGEHFIPKGFHYPHLNLFVRAFILSELFIWSAMNFFTPIFAIFVISNIEGGNVQIAAFSFSFYMLVRVLFELIIGKFLGKGNDRKKIFVAISGISIISLGYLGLAFTHTTASLLIFMGLCASGIGIASPAKNALFSIHLDKGKESSEWGIYDAVSFVGMASATALGGFIANQYGFTPVLILASIINVLGIIPYIYYIK